MFLFPFSIPLVDTIAMLLMLSTHIYIFLSSKTVLNSARNYVPSFSNNRTKDTLSSHSFGNTQAAKSQIFSLIYYVASHISHFVLIKLFAQLTTLELSIPTISPTAGLRANECTDFQSKCSGTHFALRLAERITIWASTAKLFFKPCVPCCCLVSLSLRKFLARLVSGHCGGSVGSVHERRNWRAKTLSLFII